MSLLLSAKSVFETIRPSVHNLRKPSKRGVSEIIGGLLLLAITVVGGVVVFAVLQNSDQLTFVTPDESLNPNVIPNLILSGYDTRDAIDLYGIDAINNLTGTASGTVDLLCTKTSCAGSGNEFIILRVRNDSNTVVEITSISVNEVEHTFNVDPQLVNNVFLTDGTTLPGNGEFIIISGFGISSLKQESAAHLPEASEKRLVIRLSASIDPDISLSSNIRVIINSTAESTQLLIIPAGSLI